MRGPGYSFRNTNPEGLPVPGKIEGIVTDEAGWPVPRANVTLVDGKGKVLGTAASKRDGSYAFVLDAPCTGCSIKAERPGFSAKQKTGVNYNGSNSLFFSFALSRTN